MEVNHDAMKQTANATTPTGASGAMEHDPNAAPQFMDPSNPPMGFRSGAVPDQYESYPEVMPPGGLGAPSPYSQSAQAISPAQSTGGYDRYQTTSPGPVGQNQPYTQNAPYDQTPMSVEAEKTYYQPTYGVNQPPPPAPYNNANMMVPDPNNATPSYDKVGGAGAGTTLPPPVGYNPPAAGGEKKILGMKKKTFWIVLIVLIILILAGIGGAVGGVLASKNKNNKSNGALDEAGSSNNGTNSGSNNGTNGGSNNGTSGGNSGGYTPFPLTTGVRTLNLKYEQNTGSCNDPQHADGDGFVNCYASSQYTVRVDGSVENGYRLSSVNVQGSTFSNIRGTPPTTSDPTQNGSGWVFEVSFSQGGSCGTDRITRYVFGVDDNIYAIGEAFSLQSSCILANGITYPRGTACTCVAISTTAG